jgi:hypothetical protein
LIKYSPLFLPVFSDSFSKPALNILKEYPTPQTILAENIDTLTTKIKLLARKSNKWATDKVLYSPYVEKGAQSNIFKLNLYIDIIEILQQKLTSLEKRLKT